MINFWNIINEVKENKAKAETLDKLGEVTSEKVTSDKLGSDCIAYYVNGIEVRREYKENGLAKGTADNPYYFAEGEENTMIPNAFYLNAEGVRYAYMGVEMTATTWAEVADYMGEI